MNEIPESIKEAIKKIQIKNTFMAKTIVRHKLTNDHLLILEAIQDQEVQRLSGVSFRNFSGFYYVRTPQYSIERVYEWELEFI